jgi:diadenylate cyclase
VPGGIILDVILDIINNMWSYLSIMTIWDMLDIAVLAIGLFKLIQLMRKSNAMRVLKGIATLLAIMLLSELIGLRMINFVLVNVFQVGLFALCVVFQPELRKMLERMGNTVGLRGIMNRDSSTKIDHVISQTVAASTALSWKRHGALIVFERTVLLDDIVKTGTLVDAQVTCDLILNLFYPKSPLHDGAVIIRSERIAGAGCVLPLTDKLDFSRDMGMRHRAAIGMSENSDAIVVIVSEESGSISVAESGLIKRHLAPDTLEALLRRTLTPASEKPSDASNAGFIKRIYLRMRGNK